MTLANKLGITDSAELARMEEKISKVKALELFEKGILNEYEVGTFGGISRIHRYLFEDIYEFAGKARTVNIAKESFRFAPTVYLETALDNISKMPQNTFDEIVEKYVEIKVLLKAALTTKINDREVYMKGIDVSYHYKGYNVYTTEELSS